MNPRISELRAKLHELNRKYYVGIDTGVTDAEFDQMMRELKQLELLNPEDFDPNSPTARVGSDLANGFDKVKHDRPMLSLDNTFNVDELLSFFGGTAQGLIVEWKVDGLSLSLIYRKGRLVRAVTRGDGTQGDDVTANARTIWSIPLVLREKIDVEVRGEVYLSRDDFERLNAECLENGDDQFANPRNAAAGTLKQKDSTIVAKRRLSFVAYHLLGEDHTTQGALVDRLDQLEFKTLGRHLVDAGELEAMISSKEQERGNLPFDVDGLVFKIDDVRRQDELGTGTKSPRWACAYKFTPEVKHTTLERIEVQVGRTGVLTPVAVLTPVVLAGATVTRASLCNWDEIRRLQVAEGDIVSVSRQGEVIPKVLGLTSKKSSFSAHPAPAVCPCCGTAAVRESNYVAFRCPNFNCKDQAVQRLHHAVSKPCLDWDGLGEAQVRLLVDNGITRLSQLMSLDPSTVFKSALSRKFLLERERVKSQPMWRKLHALGIDGIGATTCKTLAMRYPTIDLICSAPASELKALIGDVKARSLAEGLLQLADQMEFDHLEEHGFVFEDEVKSGPLSGKVLCITGSLMTGTRDQVSKRIEDAGGVVKGSVGKATDYLVIGESPGGNKTSAAAKYGTKVLTEEQLYALIGIPVPEQREIPTDGEF